MGLLQGLLRSRIVAEELAQETSWSPTAPSPPASTVVATGTVPQTLTRTTVQVPEACLDAAELADEVTSRLSRNDRDNRLALALRDYTIASQACRRQAAP